ncbi:multicopper oxidase family protein [Salinisphaera hydrothermalis]|uniref:Bilirubin oxidase n=1 Tax=Salinisphaera hydrothermalis (strain C41B8) TaxID=1304275 RepID=A0A084IQK6_SALHC|nr:multicopper oxidase [Salinisphaera hydrothermalis]KEZ78990.1 bilirubin oxidase [Salinisphaera hydrothermalis C41B8]
MTISRRHFLRMGAAGAATAGIGMPALGWGDEGRKSPQALSMDPRTLARYVDALPVPPKAAPTRQWPLPDEHGQRIPHYRVSMNEAEVQVHRDMKPTRMWTYDGSHPGPTFDTVSGQAISVEWVNNLPSEHFLPVDYTVCGMKPGAQSVRNIVHVHGGRTPAASDGYPEDWYPPGESKTAHYPNGQEATTLWYHDHAMGVSRLNHYAGMMGAFLIRDEVEAALGLPNGDQEIPLIICDRYFSPEGQLYYPTSGIPGHPWISEFRGNAIMINGKLYPYLEVEPRKYRFRVVNGSNQRFLRLALGGKRPFHQIGSDQGLLSAPVPMTEILLAPAERADLVVDFADWSHQTFTLTNDGHAVMQLRVGGKTHRDRSQMPSTLRPVPRIPEAQAVRTRHLTLNDYMRPTGDSMLMLLNGTRWYAEPTEDPELGSVEIWNLINLTEDTHPIHLHLVRFQILDRRPIDMYLYENHKKLRYVGPSQGPAANEVGWKDVVQAHPGSVTRIIVPFDGYPGRYVWHCHIWEHAANEMMRPYIVRPPAAT